MRRIRLPLGRSVYFLLAFFFCLVALLPLRLAIGWLGLDARGFAAREVIGSLWLGAVREAEFGPVPIGDVSARLRTLPLLVGRARIDLTRGGEADRLEGAVTAGRHAFGVDDVTASLDTAQTLAPLPLVGLDLDGVSAHFADGGCASADGLVKARFAGNLSELALPSAFSGNARCEAGDLFLPLVSASGQERLAIRLSDDGRYRIELSLPAGDTSTRAKLTAAGFAPLGPNYVLKAQGTF